MSQKKTSLALLILAIALLKLAFLAVELDNRPIFGIGDAYRHQLAGLFAAAAGTSFILLAVHVNKPLPGKNLFLLGVSMAIGLLWGSAVVHFRQYLPMNAPTGSIALFGALCVGFAVPWLGDLVRALIKLVGGK